MFETADPAVSINQPRTHPFHAFSAHRHCVLVKTTRCNRKYLQARSVLVINWPQLTRSRSLLTRWSSRHVRSEVLGALTGRRPH